MAKSNSESDVQLQGDGESKAVGASPSMIAGAVTVNTVDASPAVRAAKNKDALNRQRTNKPPQPRQSYIVEVAKGSETLHTKVEAANEGDAWALACDSWKYHPGGQAPGRRVMTADEFKQQKAADKASANAV